MIFACPLFSPAVINMLICAVPNTPVVKPIAVLAICDERLLLIEPTGKLGGTVMFGSTSGRACSRSTARRLFQIAFIEPLAYCPPIICPGSMLTA